MPSRRVTAGILVFSAALPAHAQIRWQPAWPAPRDCLTAYNPHRGVLLIADSRGDSWEWDGRGFARIASGGPSSSWMSRRLIYDESRRTYILPGGGHAMQGDPFPTAQWGEFDGAAWSFPSLPIADGPAPNPRTGYALAYNPDLAGIDLYGGYYNFRGSPSGYAIFSDFWSFSAGAWTSRQVGQPGPRVGSEMVYDYNRGVMLLMGGAPDIYTFTYHDQWERGPGQSWRRVAEDIPRMPFDLAWDASRAAVIGFSGAPASRRILANGAWSDEPVEASPPTSTFWGRGFDGGRGVLIALGESERYSDLIDILRPGALELRGSAWVRPAPLPPIGRTVAVMTFDEARGEFVLFGGFSGGVGNGARLIPDPSTWTLRGEVWTRREVAGPAQVMNSAMVFDSRRGVSLLFGGRVPPLDSTYTADTWEWDGASWTRRTPAAQPAARARHAMAFDRRRGVAVLFGGRSAASPITFFPETWEWDGDRWTRRDIAGPGGRIWTTMAYDEARGVTVLFGGVNASNTPLADTWEYDGASWTRRDAPGPAGRGVHQMVYDPDRRVIVMWGGGDGAHALLDLWEWDGARWQSRPDLALSHASSGAAAGYDRGSRRTLSFGGTSEQTFVISNLTPEMSILGPDCAEPVITRQPGDAATHHLGSLALSLDVQPGPDLHFQWRRGWPPAVIEGAEGPILTIEHATLAHAGRYDCIVTSEGPCFRRRAVSDPAQVLVCAADFNGDGLADHLDYADFVRAYETGDLSADVNGDGFIDFFDHDAFIEHLELGC